MGMSAADLRLSLAGLILEGKRKPSYLIKEGLAQRVNLILDIDHTLVHSIN